MAAWRVELVGGPFCGRWHPLPALPDEREFLVTGPAPNEPVYRGIYSAVYFLETDECDFEQRASYVRPAFVVP